MVRIGRDFSLYPLIVKPSGVLLSIRLQEKPTITRHTIPRLFESLGSNNRGLTFGVKSTARLLIVVFWARFHGVSPWLKERRQHEKELVAQPDPLNGKWFSGITSILQVPFHAAHSSPVSVRICSDLSPYLHPLRIGHGAEGA